MEKLDEVLTTLLTGMVAHPDAVETHFSEDRDQQGDLIVVNVKVHQNDVGMCIGTNGSTAEAIRKVIGLVGFRQYGKRVYVKIDAPKIPRNHFHVPETEEVS